MTPNTDNVIAMPTRQSPFLTTQGASEYLGVVTTRTLERFRLEGGGPKYGKIGRKVVYKVEWLNAWLEGRVFENTAQARKAGCR